MKRWVKKFEDAMAAAAFAEAGEHEKAKDILKGKKTILLAVSDRVFNSDILNSNKNVLKYALNISKRMESDIDILYLTKSAGKNQFLKEFLTEAEKEGIKCTLVKRDGCMKKAILEYTEKKKEILFVVVGSTPELDIECTSDEKTLSDAWKRLKCPLVVVSKNEVPLPA